MLINDPHLMEDILSIRFQEVDLIGLSAAAAAAGSKKRLAKKSPFEMFRLILGFCSVCVDLLLHLQLPAF